MFGGVMLLLVNHNLARCFKWFRLQLVGGLFKLCMNQNRGILPKTKSIPVPP